MSISIRFRLHTPATVRSPVVGTELHLEAGTVVELSSRITPYAEWVLVMGGTQRAVQGFRTEAARALWLEEYAVPI